MYARGNDGLRRKRRRSSMNIRETMEQWERQNLSPYASLSSETLGRDREEPLCDIRPAYQRDRDRILHSKSFRRLKDKTQVFLAPEGDHYRTRQLSDAGWIYPGLWCYVRGNLTVYGKAAEVCGKTI